MEKIVAPFTMRTSTTDLDIASEAGLLFLLSKGSFLYIMIAQMMMNFKSPLTESYLNLKKSCSDDSLAIK